MGRKRPRLDQERQNKLEPSRMETAKSVLSKMGFDVKIGSDNKSLQFVHKGEIITYWPYSGWASGKTIKDGRGFTTLIRQIS